MENYKVFEKMGLLHQMLLISVTVEHLIETNYLQSRTGTELKHHIPNLLCSDMSFS